MANLPLQDGYETQLAQSWDGAVGTIYVLETPVYTPKTTPTIITVNPGKTNAQLAVINDYDASAKTLTVSAVTGLEKALGVSSTTQSHGTGSKVIISDNYEFWKDLVNTTDTQTITGNKTFSGTNAFTGVVNLSSVADLNVDGKSNPAPVVADTTARDALYPSPVTGDMVWVTSLNALQIYNSATAQWVTQDAGTPAPVATPSAQGIVKIHAASADPKAIVSEEAGTSGTAVSASNKLVDNADTATTPTASKIVRYDTNAKLGADFTPDTTYPAGETLSAGNVVFIENAPTTAQATSAQNIGDVTANTRVSFPVFGSGVAGTTLALNLAKVGSPSVTLGVRIETDNAGSPSGTLVNANATGTVAAASVGAGTFIIGTATTTVGTIPAFTTTTSAQGVRILTKGILNNIIVNKSSGSGATRAILKSDAGTTLATATFSGNAATINYILDGQTSYRIELDKSGASYTYALEGGASYPYVGTNLNITSQSIDGTGTDTTNKNNIESITTTGAAEATVTLAGSVTIPAGQKCHIVTFQGTYGSETVNASNYYKVGYYTNDSTTRGQKLWNGSVHSAMDTVKVPYTSSTLFQPRVLSKTDADYSYKIDWHGITQEAVTAGDLTTGKYPKIAISGIDSNQSGMTQGTTMYLSNTAGAISSSAGTNSKKLGKAISDTKIKIVDIPL